MAATATKPASKIKVKNRAKSLKVLSTPPADLKFPVELASAHPRDVAKWSEPILDELEKAGSTIKGPGWTALVNGKIEDPEQRKAVIGALKSIYARPAGDGASTPAPKKGAAPAKAGKAARNGNGKKKAADAAPRAEMVPVRFNNKTKIPATWTKSKDSERNTVLIFEEHGPRAVARALGKKGWSNEQILNLFVRMGLENYHHNMKQHVVGAHAAAGRNNDGEMYGAIPSFDREQWGLLEAERSK